MNLSFFIARRYLFSKKKQHVINLISWISVIGVMVGCAALVITTSAFNGIDDLLTKAMKGFTPDYEISTGEGKFFRADTALLSRINKVSSVVWAEAVLEETALVRYKEAFLPVTVKGVSENYPTLTGITKDLRQGSFILRPTEAPARGVLGGGIASQLHYWMGAKGSLFLYYPERGKSTVLGNPSLNTVEISPSGIFSAQQDLDNQYIFVPLSTAETLFSREESWRKIEIRTTANAQSLKKEIQKILPPTLLIQDKYEVNRSYYAMMRSEKWAIFIVMLFILMIASFNIIGSVSMLILDKRDDISTFAAMGMNQNNLITLFRREGMMITAIGAALGLIIGVGAVLLQQQYGLIALGTGLNALAYPVKLKVLDLLWITAGVAAIGYIASQFPVRILINRLLSPHK